MKLVSVGMALWFTSILAGSAFANWFEGSSLRLATGHKLLIGAASTPSPDNLCAIGDSDADRCYTDASRKVRRNYVLNEKSGHYREVRPDLDEKSAGNQATKPVEPRSTRAGAEPGSP
jgi:hypothetical protein